MQEMDDAPSLELLRCFAVLHDEGHLSRAAARRGLSQPAMSRALARLRQLFGDPLFVRTPRGMLATQRADELAPRVAAVLDAARSLAEPAAFDPARLTRTFTIATAGFFDGVLVPRLVHALARAAPGAAITTRPIDGGLADGSLIDGLASGQLDLMISIRASMPASLRHVRLYEDSFVCAVRRGHPSVGRRLSLPTFIALPHLLIAPIGAPGSRVDSALAARGLSRRVAVRIHSFAQAPAIVAASDLVLTAPRRLIEPLARRFDLRVFASPVELAPFGVFAAWHPRVHADPAHAWFRGQIQAVSR
jgi:DNA-binding transcriptional LysR family regulator